MSLTLTATPYPFDTESRVRLDIASSAPVGATANFLITRTNPDGRVYPVIMEANPRLTSGAWSGYDYHCPFGVSVQYTVTVGIYQASSGGITLSPGASWLIHRTNPALSVELTKVISIADTVQVGTSALHWPIGASFPSAPNEGVRRARSGSIVVQVDSQAMQQNLIALFSDGGVILVNLSGPDVGWWDESWAWIQPTDITTVNPSGFGWIFYPTRNLTIPYQVVDQPSGLLTPLWTYADLVTTYADYAAFDAAYNNYGDAVIDNRAF